MILIPIRNFFESLQPVWRWLMGILLAAALIGGGLAVVHTMQYCRADIARFDGTCVGITDGSQGAVFGEGTAEALRLIGEENARIAAEPTSKGIVSIAYLVPIPPPGVEDSYATRLAGDIMGAAVAQRQANRTITLVGDRPLIRLLVVNVGNSSNPAREPVDKLIDMTRSGFAEHKLMAVVVSGKSLDPLIGALDAMVAADVPVIVSHLTAERITSATITADTSLVRVAPTTSDESAALAAYLRPTSSRALIVQNSDQGDQYAASLGESFRKHYVDVGHTIALPDETYRSGTTAANAMDDILVNICQQRPDVVFFAGRAAELSPLVAALPKRTCLDHPIRVVTGDDGASFAEGVVRDEPGLREGLNANASVAYTSLANPTAWQAAPDRFAPRRADFLTGHCENCFATLFPDRSLDDSYAIMAYDAVLTAITAIRQPDGSVDTPSAVIQEFKRLHGPKAVAGASGWISLSANGHPVDKAVAIMDVGADGTSRFLQLSSPSGTPCTPGSPPC